MKKILTRFVPVLIFLAFVASWLSGRWHHEFIAAVRAGELQKVRRLSKHMPAFILDAYHKPPNMSTRSIYGDTALHVAIKHAQIEMIEFLIIKGSSLDSLTADYKNPLQLASELGLKEGVELLLKHGAEVDACGSEAGTKTALFFAAENLHPKIVEILLAAGADRQRRDFAGRTPGDLAEKRQLLYDENSTEERFGYGRSHQDFNAWVVQRRQRVLDILR